MLHSLEGDNIPNPEKYPCPCGFYNHPDKECGCSPGMVQKYLNKISGPLLDRMDIHIEVVPVPFDKLSEAAESERSVIVRDRVITAREIQKKRFEAYPDLFNNAQMSTKLQKKFCEVDEAGKQLLKTAIEKLDLSARAYDRILKVSRNIADLDNNNRILPNHLAEAINYRSLDRESWAG